MLEEEPTPASAVHPPTPASPSLGRKKWGIWLSLPVHGLTPGLFPSTVLPLPGLGSLLTVHLPGYWGTQVGQGSDPGTKGPFQPTWERDVSVQGHWLLLL